MATAEQSRLIHQTMLEAEGTKVKYIAGDNGEIAELPVIAGDGSFEFRTDEGVYETWLTRTYLVQVEDLCIGNTIFLPKKGYKIEEVNALGETDRYEVLPLDNGRGYEVWDNAGVVINITTKLVSANV